MSSSCGPPSASTSRRRSGGSGSTLRQGAVAAAAVAAAAVAAVASAALAGSSTKRARRLWRHLRCGRFRHPVFSPQNEPLSTYYMHFAILCHPHLISFAIRLQGVALVPHPVCLHLLHAPA